MTRGATEEAIFTKPPNYGCRETLTPIQCEVSLIHPAYAVLMIGTDDPAWRTVRQFPRSYNEAITELISAGVVPILTEIPPDPTQQAAVAQINADVYQAAKAGHLPLINLYAALWRLPNHGLSQDNLHPSLLGGPDCVGFCDPASCAPLCQPANFTVVGLKYGYDERNLLTLRTLARLRQLAAR